MSKKQLHFLSIFLVIFFINFSAQATQFVPDSGQFSDELKKQPNLNQPGNVDLLKQPEDNQSVPANANDIRIQVNGVKVSGSQQFDHQVLETLVSELIGGRHNFAEIDAAVARITQYYRQRGYLVARAYLPAQDLKEGIIQINILEGQLGQPRINNNSKIVDPSIAHYLDSIKTGIALKSDGVDRAVLLISDLAGVGGARATLQPGASVGTSDLIVEVDPGKSYTGNIELDNYGSYYTGKNRLGAAIAFNSPLKLGDQLTVRALKSDGDLTYARLAYQLPVGSSGLKLGAAYSDMSYTLGREYKDEDFHGTAKSASVFATYPFIRSQQGNLFGTLSFEHKDFRDVNVDVIEKKVRLYNLGLTGSRQDTLFGGGFNSFESSMMIGNLSMDPISQAQDRVSANSEGAFTRLNLSFNRLQRINDLNILAISISGQATNKNLNSSEKFYLGGANGVRAFPQSEAGGDQGVMMNLELRHSINDMFQAIAFYDVGSVRINHNSYITDASNVRTISGAGVGVNAQYKALQFKTSLAWRINGGTYMSVPRSEDDNLRLWVQLGGAF